jgi:hypothetical protein
MEVAGLAVGVVGLAGILSVLRDVAELYSLFVDSRTVGRGYEMLDTKLDIERTMLLHWADRVGLLRDDYDPRLDIPGTQETVFRVLACIRTLLSDTSQLKTRYGVQTFDVPDSETGTQQTLPTPEESKKAINGTAMERLARDLDKLRLRKQGPEKGLPALEDSKKATDGAPVERLARDLDILPLRRHTLGQASPALEVTKKATNGAPIERMAQELDKLRLRKRTHEHKDLTRSFSWAIRDKQKFADLVDDLSHFTTKLNDLLPATSGPSVSQSEPSPAQEMVGQCDIDKRAIPNTVEDVVDQKYQDKILETLWFRTMEAREEEIKPAHAQTLSWALEPPDGKVLWDDLSEWLKSGENIYWVSGKAGSGKSTLMKWLLRHPRTKELLAEWAKGGPVNVANFFFWNLGTPEQKTQEGLSRSILHQILSRHPSLIREALPGMWKELKITNDSVSLPSLGETRQAFRVIAANASSLGKFCFLIDGLDEFIGDYRNAIDFLQELTANPGFKALVSSRPIPACVDAFEDNPTLPLNHLMHHDIATYVHDIIGGHKYMKKLRTRHLPEAEELTKGIIAKSSGVFLWVVLACRSILSGFADGDRVGELLRRVGELPSELEDMFKLMLSRVSERYREQGAFTLRVCHEVTRPDSGRHFHSLKAVPIALLCREGAKPEVLSEEDKEDLRDGLAGWLTSRCGGLLETSQEMMSADGDQVVWVHRSVVEFLSGNDTWDLECLRVDEDRPGLLAALSIYALHSVMQDNIKHEIIYNIWYSDALIIGAEADAVELERKDHCFWHIKPYLDWLRQVEPIPPAAASQERLKKLMLRHSDATQAVSHAALIVAAESGALNYVKAHPDFAEFCRLGSHISCGCFPLFYHVAAHPVCSIMVANQPGRPSELRTSISLFLSLGADPNMLVVRHTWGDTYLDTPWRSWIVWVKSHLRGPVNRAAEADTMAMFLAAGADPTEEVPAWILPYLVDPKHRDALTVSDAQLASAVSALQGQILQVSQKGAKEDWDEGGRVWLDTMSGGEFYWDGERRIDA